jgi:hypothetical protein
MRICTIAARNYLPQARVLARSYAEHNCGESCTVLLLDDPRGTVDDRFEPFDVMRPAQAGVERFAAMAATHDVQELAALLKPLLVRFLLEFERAPLACVDADVRFFNDIEEIAYLVASEGIVITPHGGFVAVAPGDDTDTLLDWWRGRLRFGPDELRSVVSRFHVVRDPGVNVRYRNLSELVLERSGDGYTVDGAPLRFVHFSGFDPARPYAPVRQHTRGRLTAKSPLASLAEGYAAELRDAGSESGGERGWMYAALGDGTPLTATLRRLYGQGERERAFRLSPFNPEGAAEFAKWCQGAASRGSAYGLTRAALAVYEERADLRAAFPDLDGEDGPGFLRWISDHRQDAADLGLPPDWLSAARPGSPGNRSPRSARGEA